MTNGVKLYIFLFIVMPDTNLNLSTDIEITIDASSGVDLATVVSGSFEVKDPSGTVVPITNLTKTGSGNRVIAKAVAIPPVVGTYSVEVKPDALKDLAGVPVQAGAIGTFVVDYAFLNQQVPNTNVAYILGGQSNMVGGFSDTLFTGTAPQKTKWWSDAELDFVPLVPGGAGGFRAWENPVVHTALNLEALYPNLNFYFIEYSSGGDGFLSGAGAFASGGAAEIELLRRVRGAVGAMSATLPSFVWGGFIWNQGEAECFSTTNANNFPAQFQILVNKLKILTGNPLMKVHVTRISSQYNSPTTTLLNLVRGHLVTMGDSWTDVDPVAPNVAALTLPPDLDGKNRHQSAAGYALIGSRYAQAVNLFPVYPAGDIFAPPTVGIGTPPTILEADTTLTLALTFTGLAGKIVGSALPNISLTSGNSTAITGTPVTPLPANAKVITHNYEFTIPGGATLPMQGTNRPITNLTPISDTSGNSVASNTLLGEINLVVTSTGDTTPPSVTVLNTPLPSFEAGGLSSVVIRVIDAVSITSGAFVIKNPSGIAVAQTAVVSGTDITLSFRPTVVGAHTIEVVASTLQDSAGNFTAAGVVGTFTTVDAAIGPVINDNFRTMSALPAHWSIINPSATKITFNSTTGLSLARVGTTVADGRTAIISDRPWDQNRPLQILFRGHTIRASSGLSLDPVLWVARAADPKDTLTSLRAFNVYWGHVDQIAPFGTAYATSRDYRTTYTKSGADVVVTIEELVSSVWQPRINVTAVGASALLRNARIFCDARDGTFFVKQITN